MIFLSSLLPKIIKNLILLVMMFMFSSTHAQSTIPMLYYYSSQDKAFIIEDVNGDDRRILAQYEPLNNQTIRGDGWSPSGQWFTWTGNTGLGGDTTVFIVNRDGSNIFELLIGEGQIHDLRWSPTDDLLLIWHNEFTATENIGKVHVFQPTTEQFLLSEVAYRGEWTLDGQYIALYSTLPSTEARMSVFDSSGHFIATRTIPRTCGINYAWSNLGQVIYSGHDGNDLILEDFSDDSIINISTLPDGVIRHIDWHPEGLYALLYLQPSCESGVFHAGLWRLSVEDASLQWLADDIQLPHYAHSRVMARLDTLFPQTAWSPNGEYAFFISSDQTEHTAIHLYENASADSHNLTQSIIGTTHSRLISWFNADELIFARNTPEGSVIYRYETNGEVVSLIEETLSFFYISFIALSSDRRWLAFSGNGGFLLDILSNRLQEMVLTTSDPRFAEIDEIIWQSESEWFFVLGQLAGSGTRWVVITNTDLSDIRELGELGISKSYFGWLPDENSK